MALKQDLDRLSKISASVDRRVNKGSDLQTGVALDLLDEVLVDVSQALERFEIYRPYLESTHYGRF